MWCSHAALPSVELPRGLSARGGAFTLGGTKTKVALSRAYNLGRETPRSRHFLSNSDVYLGTFMIGLCWTSPSTLTTPATENDPSAFLLVSLQSILEIASSQVSASTVVCAKTAGPQTIVKAATIEAAAKRVCGAIAGSPSRKVHFNQCAYSVVGCIASASALPGPAPCLLDHMSA